MRIISELARLVTASCRSTGHGSVAEPRVLPAVNGSQLSATKTSEIGYHYLPVALGYGCYGLAIRLASELDLSLEASRVTSVRER